MKTYNVHFELKREVYSKEIWYEDWQDFEEFQEDLIKALRTEYGNRFDVSIVEITEEKPHDR